jgi:hypothetical protein
MAYINPKYFVQVYRSFREIDPVSYREIVRFYEKEEQTILKLNFDEFFEILVAYVDALFEIGAYRKHLVMVDSVIELSIDHNVRIYKQEDLFYKMLFRKAASLYNTHRFKEAEHILGELLKMDADNAHTARFYRKCRFKARPGLLNTARAVSVFFFLLSALIISIEVLFVRPWYAIHVDLVEQTRNSIFVLGCLGLLLGFGLNLYLSHRDLINFRQSIVR